MTTYGNLGEMLLRRQIMTMHPTNVSGGGAKKAKNLNNNPMAQQKAGPLKGKATSLAMKAQKAGPLGLSR